MCLNFLFPKSNDIEEKVDIIKEYNVSSGFVNYSQRNNKFIYKRGDLKVCAENMCNVTSYVMTASYNGIILPENPKYEQPEDAFADFLLNDSEVNRYYKEKFPAMYDAYSKGYANAMPPNLVHSILAYGFNLWLQSDIVEFNDKCPVKTIQDEIMNNRSVVISGRFPYNDSYINHVVSLVGLTYNETKGEVLKYIIDDPFGNLHYNYTKGISGNDVILSNSNFINYIKEIGNTDYKWAHTFKKGAKLV